VADADVISTIWDSMMCCTLVNELGQEHPKTTKELLDITTRHASGEEAVGTTFILGNAKAAVSGGWAAPSKATIKETRKGTNCIKKGSKQCLQCVIITASNDDDNEKADDSDEVYVTTAKHDFKC
jgi:hypothetical protein